MEVQQRNEKWYNVGSEIQIKHTMSHGKNSWFGDVDTDIILKNSRYAARGIQPKPIYWRNEETVFDKKDEDVPQEVVSALPSICFILIFSGF